MTTEEYSIDKEFLVIEPLDSLKLDEFYNRNREYFARGFPNDKEEQEKYLTMICEIGNSYSLSERHIEAVQILEKAEMIFKKIGIDEEKYQAYNSIIFSLANSNFHLKKYYKALIYFQRYAPSEKEKQNTATVIKICKNKIKNNIIKFAGILGFLILTIKYSIKWFSPENYSTVVQNSGWLGGILLLAYGLMSIVGNKNNNR